jgi:hypothetical protein
MSGGPDDDTGDGSSSTTHHHALVLSLSDLSVWCYACGCYVKHDRLLPLLVRAEAMYVRTYVHLHPPPSVCLVLPVYLFIYIYIYIYQGKRQGPLTQTSPTHRT